MLEIQQYDFILNPFCGTFAAGIKGLVASMYLRNAAEYTGMSAAEASLRSALAENMVNSESVNRALALVQTDQGRTASVGRKLDQIKKLAGDAAAGGFSAARLADMQGQMQVLAEEIDNIAHGSLGETHLLTANGLTQKVFIGNGMYLDIETRDLTSAGLGLKDVNITSDPHAALANIEAAAKEYNAYRTYLDGRCVALQTTASALQVQRSTLFAVQSAIESTDAALRVVGLVDAHARAAADTLIIAQANASAQTVLNLLAD